MSEIKIGRISLNESSWLEFTIRDWKGENYACIRKFVDTDRYSGPTKSGLNLHRQGLAKLLEAVRRLKEDIPGREEKEFCRLAKSDENEIVVCIIPPKDSGSFPAVDIREFVDTPGYTGPTKKGIRFSWDRLNEVAELMEEQGKCILDVGSSSPGTSPDTALTQIGRAHV